MIDYRIDTFLEICKHMNITKAARKLNITQPAASKHIKHIEEEYNIKLFNYEGKKLSLTKEGKIFLSYATTLKHDDIYLRQKISTINLKNKKINFGSTLTTGEYMMPESLSRYLKSNQDINVNMIISNTNNLLEYIDNGRIDFAIIEGYFPKSEFDYIKISTNNFIGICSKENPLKNKEVSINSLLNERLIIREEGSGSRDIIDKYLSSENISISHFKNKIEVNNINVIKKFVEENIGISFLYEVAVKDELLNHNIYKINIQDFKIKHDFNFVFRKNSKFKEYYYNIFSSLIKN